MDISFWEKFTDRLGAISEGFVGFLGRLFGSSNDRIVRSLGFARPRNSLEHTVVPGSVLERVNLLENEMMALTDEELKSLTPAYRERLAAGEPLDDLLPEAFAACRESARRSKNMRHYDTQIIGGAVLHRGMIAEMVTGEGKTLVATLPAYLNALTGQGVHVITVNDYLARRDCEWMSPIFHGLGISCGFIQSDMDPVDRRKAYECDITYGTNSEFGFDYLRDNMKTARWGDEEYDPREQQVQRALNYAIIDEVDNILIDEARTPLIIAGSAFGDLKRYAKANELAVKLTELERKAQHKLKEIGHGVDIPDHPLNADEAADENAEAITTKETGIKKDNLKKRAMELADKEEIDVANITLPEEGKEKRLGYYFEVKEKERTCHLTDEGIRKAEELAGVESFYTAGNMEWPHLIDNALKAHHLYQKEKQYLLLPDRDTKELSVVIVDEFTGRPMYGRHWSDGLHQAVEAKHARDGIRIKEESQTLATVTLQNFFKLYGKLAGMTGTAMTEANEFWKIYKLEVVAIPTNKPLIRTNYADVIYLSEKEKWDAVVAEIETINRWDVVRLKDGTFLLGTIKEETDTTLDIEIRDTRERRTVTEAEVVEIQRRGRPILVGTTDVAKSEKLAKMLTRRGIKHELLNAKPEFAPREAEIVAQAGRIGAVTIATNMAGRGTDIILGGNPEYLAWAKLKEKYRTRLDVPDDEWKKVVDDIKTKEKMEEEGREVADMGGLHIVGTERHEARRIDNQLRGRAGRQGDPGSSRFFLSLEDDLMRVFAGEWVKKVLTSLGMEQGQAIESRMVSRRIESAQKKVEEKNFDRRKHLLEYDEVKDHQRKRTYGYRQEILNGANCKMRIQDMIDGQIEAALDRYLADDFGPASFAQLAADRLGVEFDPSDFVRASYDEATRLAHDRALDMLSTQIQDIMDENLPPDAEDKKEWNWQALTNAVNSKWSLKTTERGLKQIGRDNLAEHIIEQARKTIAEVDLSKGAAYLDPNWGLQSYCIWALDKFQVKIDAKELVEKDRAYIKERLAGEIRKLYREREIEFPVTLAMARFMADRQGHVGPMQQRYDRDGLHRWYLSRFVEPQRPRTESLPPPEDAIQDPLKSPMFNGGGGTAVAVAPPPSMVQAAISEESFRTLSRVQLRQLLVEESRKLYPVIGHDGIDAHVAESLAGTQLSEEEDARELTEWFKETFGIEVNIEDLTGVTQDEARNVLWNAFDARHRPEMRRMERSLLLEQLDLSWKNHLYVMDHLEQGVGLVGYAQIDPKTEFKRQGMKEFDMMWVNVEDKISSTVFRMEDVEAFQHSVWSIGATIKETAKGALQAGDEDIRAQQNSAIAAGQGEKKIEPIRNRQQKVGRNDPCPCGSGKKYKNCHMRLGA
jgi:preprotein translocase subunit SecA